MSKYSILRDELTNDPLSRGYSGMTDEQKIADLNTAYRTQNKSSLTGDEVFSQTDTTEYTALTDTEKQLWLAFCGRESIDPFSAANVTFVTNLMGSTTIASINSIRTTPITRAQELGIGEVGVGLLQIAQN